MRKQLIASLLCPAGSRNQASVETQEDCKAPFKRQEMLFKKLNHDGTTETAKKWRRFFVPSWFNSFCARSCFRHVVETRLMKNRSNLGCRLWGLVWPPLFLEWLGAAKLREARCIEVEEAFRSPQKPARNYVTCF